MHLLLKRWIHRHGDISSDRTTVLLYGDALTLALTFPGRLTRRQAGNKLWDHLVRDGRSSSELLQQVKNLLAARKGGRACTP